MAHRYMMATKAHHNFGGDISRNAPSLCAIYNENADNFIGRWATGPTYNDVAFPKETTRELTKREKARWNGNLIRINGFVIDTICFDEICTT